MIAVTMEFKLSKTKISNNFCKTPISLRQWILEYYCKKYTKQQVIFVLLTTMFFKKRGEGDYVISAIGTCHEIVLPLIKFSAMLYNEDEKNFFVFHLRTDLTNPNVKISGLDENFNRRASEDVNGHTGVCIKKNETYYVFDIILGLLTPVKLDDYLSIVVNAKIVWIHILEMMQDGKKIQYRVEYDNMHYKVNAFNSSENIKCILKKNLKAYKSLHRF